MVTDSSLHGCAVLSKDGVKIGEVTHLVVDAQTFRIAALEVHIHKDVAERAGLSHGLLRGPTIQIPTDRVQSIGDAVILAVPIHGLRNIVASAGDSDHAGHQTR